jgi:hypothetical protein
MKLKPGEVPKPKAGHRWLADSRYARGKELIRWNITAAGVTASVAGSPIRKPWKIGSKGW